MFLIIAFLNCKLVSVPQARRLAMDWAVLFLSWWTIDNFGWYDVVTCEARHAGGSGGMPPRKFILSEVAFGGCA